MKKHLLFVSILITALFSQSDDIPYDWSGQYGVISNNGRVMWNQDWTLGVLFFDGTIANYPTRFGSSYQNNFRISDVSDFYTTLHSYPDSTQINSKIDYNRGDFSYDQLEFDMKIAGKNRIISLSAFKRNYGGPYGQYVAQDGTDNPLQQSYRLDFSSKNNDALLDIAVGYFKTDSRFNFGETTQNTHKEDIISAGVGYSDKIWNMDYNLHGALFQQNYKLELGNVNAYLNRVHLNQFIKKTLKDSNIVKFGLQLDKQSLSLVDSTKRDRLWSTVYSDWERGNHKLELGTTFSQKKLFPYGKISTILTEGDNYSLSGNIKYSVIPVNIFHSNYGDLDNFNEYLTANLNSTVRLREIPFRVNLNYENEYESFDKDYYDYYNISPYLISSSLSTVIPIFRDWIIDAQYRHTFDHNLYSDGIGDRINLGIIISENLFKNNLFAQLKIWGDAYLNHNPNIVYHGFHFGPSTYSNSDFKLPNFWVFNMDLSVKVSQMKINFRINNILQTIKSLSNDQIFTNLNENYLLINHSNYFPPLNRFMTFNIIWEFDN